MAKPREGAKDVVFTTTWRPFFLMPPQVWTRGIASGQFPEDAETEGIEKLAYYISKFGANALPPMLERLGGAMRDSGIEGFSMGGNTGPTLDGHRLATYAEREGLDKQNAFMEEISRAYFCEEKAPCDRGVLLAAAKSAGARRSKGARSAGRAHRRARRARRADAKVRARGLGRALLHCERREEEI